MFITKINPDDTIRFKARLVIKGCQQVEGLYFTETYAPVSKMDTFRMLRLSLIKSICDLLFSRGPSTAQQPHLPGKQAPAQQPVHELNPELITEFLRWLKHNI